MIKQVKLAVGNTHRVPTGAPVFRVHSDRPSDSTRPNNGAMSTTSVTQFQDGTGAYKPAPKPAPFILRGWNRVES